MVAPDPSLPLDPDLDDVEDVRHHVGAVDAAIRPPWPRLPPATLGAVFAGGCAGGLLRYAVVRAWPEHGYAVPWSTLAVNVAGSFLLAVIVVAVSRLRLHSLTRPLLGAGFCGALTTFSSFVVAADEMAAHEHLGSAALYVVLTLTTSLGAAVLGYLIAARVVVAAPVAD